MNALTVTVAEGPRTLTAVVTRPGEDLVVAVGGGERPHVGCVVVAVPVPSRRRPGEHSASVSVVTLPPHKEEPIARPIAERLAARLGRVAVVTAGVHEDGLDAAGVAVWLALAERLAEELAVRLADGAA
jgi:hypothetical protein